MPKISASTVAEHHEIQHQQVLDAALALIESSRGAVPAVGEVAKKVGLARSSVYQYISSKQDLVAQLLTRFLKQWAEEVAAAMDAAGSDPRARLDAYIESNLELFTQWQGDALMLAAAQTPGIFQVEQVHQAHLALHPSLVQSLTDAGMEKQEATVYASILDSAIHSGAKLILEGRDRAVVRHALSRMLDF